MSLSTRLPPSLQTTTTTELKIDGLISVQDALEILAAALTAAGEPGLDAIEILCSLASNGPMKLRQLMTKVELNKTRLRQHLRLPKNRDLVERQKLWM